MEGRPRFCGLARAEPEPFPLVRVPGDIERLQSPAANIDEILLQRFVGEGVFDLELGFLAVRPFGPDEELAPPLEERCQDAVMLEPDVVEIRPHSAVIGQGHRLGMVRFGECRSLIRMAGGAFFLLDEPVMNRDQRIGCGSRLLGCSCLPCERRQEKACPKQCRANEQLQSERSVSTDFDKDTPPSVPNTRRRDQSIGRRTN